MLIGIIAAFAVPLFLALVSSIASLPVMLSMVILMIQTAFMQTTLLFLGMMTFSEHMLLGLGIMLAAGEVPRIAQQFGLDSSVRVNMSSVIYSTNSAINLSRNLLKAKAV